MAALTYTAQTYKYFKLTVDYKFENDNVTSQEELLMFVEEGNNEPIIRIKAPKTLEQYSSTKIYYNVLDSD